MITLEEFQATRFETHDLGGYLHEDDLARCAGYVYMDMWVIEILPNGQFYLFFGNQQWTSPWLDLQEARLHQLLVDMEAEENLAT